MESDFYAYIGKERKKTMAKLERLRSFKFAALVLEGLSWDDLAVQSMYSTMTPEHTRGFLIALHMRYGLHFFCHRKREVIERWVLDRAVKFYNINREV